MSDTRGQLKVQNKIIMTIFHEGTDKRKQTPQELYAIRLIITFNHERKLCQFMNRSLHCKGMSARDPE